jgi:hypothetical protein
MSTKFQIRETASQKITAILIGAALSAYALVFAVQGLGALGA